MYLEKKPRASFFCGLTDRDLSSPMSLTSPTPSDAMFLELGIANWYSGLSILTFGSPGGVTYNWGTAASHGTFGFVAQSQYGSRHDSAAAYDEARSLSGYSGMISLIMIS